MPLDTSVLGRTYRTAEPFAVGREKIREFATAVGAEHAAHYDPAAAAALGYPDLVAPPTFSILIVMVVNQGLLDVLGVPHRQIIHSDQRFTYRRPILAGDQLACVSTVEDVSAKAGLQFLMTRADLTSAGEDPAVATEDPVVAGEDPVVTVWTRLVITPDNPRT
jgi:acyl dehydratase